MVEKVVSASAGMSTIVVGGDVVKVTFEGHSVNYVFIRHVSGEVLVSRLPNVADGIDGTVKLSTGGYRFDVSAPVIYISGSGVCEVSASALGDFPFKVSGKGGETPDLSAYAKKTDIPTELPANGGNADTVNGHSVNADVPADAKFTDTIPVVYGDNLLINPDFKINQRGITGTFSEVGRYFVDRWQLVSGTVTINDDGSITLNGRIEQNFETPFPFDDNAVLSASAGFSSMTTLTNAQGKTTIIGVSIDGNGETISWVKMEYGKTATPFVPPESATELVKCQRYYQVVDLGQPIFAMGNSTSIIRFGLTLPTAVRTTPTVEFVPVTGSYTWSIGLMKLTESGYIKITDVPTAAEVIVRSPNYLNIKLTLNTTELAANLSYMVIGAGGFKINLDAEIY